MHQQEMSRMTAENRALQKELQTLEHAMEEERRKRRVAEEQRQVAVRRLAEGVEEDVVVALKAENDALKHRVHTMGTEMDDIREGVRGERERFVRELADRTNKFVEVERELRDARETYVNAVRAMERNERRLSAPGHVRQVPLEEVVGMRLEYFKNECDRLATENERLRKANEVVDENKTVETVGMEEMKQRLRMAEEERDELRRMVRPLDAAERDGSERMSSSSMSSESDSVAKKVQELEQSLEEESKEAESLRRRVQGLVATATRKENEASTLRGEMVAIHSKMRRMATMSMPKGAEEMLGDSDDLKKLTEMRNQVKGDIDEEDAKQNKSTPRRRIRLSENKKMIVRPWLHK